MNNSWKELMGTRLLMRPKNCSQKEDQVCLSCSFISTPLESPCKNPFSLVSFYFLQGESIWIALSTMIWANVVCGAGNARVCIIIAQDSARRHSSLGSPTDLMTVIKKKGFYVEMRALRLLLKVSWIFSHC